MKCPKCGHEFKAPKPKKVNLSKAAALIGSIGGSSKSEAKASANRDKMRAYWDDVRAGRVTGPKHAKKG